MLCIVACSRCQRFSTPPGGAKRARTSLQSPCVLAVVIGDLHGKLVPLFGTEELRKIALAAGGQRWSVTWAKWFKNWASLSHISKSLARGTDVPLVELPAREDSEGKSLRCQQHQCCDDARASIDRMR